MNFERYRLTSLALNLRINYNGMINEMPIGLSANFFAMIISGHARFKARGVVLDLYPGELLYIPKDVPYTSEWYGEPDCHFYSMGFSFGHFSENSRFALQKLSREQLLEFNFDPFSLIEEMSTVPADSPLLLAYFYRLYSASRDVLLPSNKSDAYTALEPALRLMEKDPAADFDIPELSRLCGMSESKFYTDFKQLIGKTPIEYKNILRSRIAALMLTSTDKTVEEIAYILGCSTPSYLRRVLKKTLGKTPKEIKSEKQIIYPP